MDQATSGPVIRDEPEKKMREPEFAPKERPR